MGTLLSPKSFRTVSHAIYQFILSGFFLDTISGLNHMVFLFNLFYFYVWVLSSEPLHIVWWNYDVYSLFRSENCVSEGIVEINKHPNYIPWSIENHAVSDGILTNNKNKLFAKVISTGLSNPIFAVTRLEFKHIFTIWIVAVLYKIKKSLW